MMRNLKAFEKLLVFLGKASPPVVPLLVLDVTDDRAELRVAILERTESFLPRKPTRDPPALIDEAQRPGLDPPKPCAPRPGYGERSHCFTALTRRAFLIAGP